ncbi:MAG: hypothetical protein KDD10_15570, partial [Phaeodactylibacter sp.]|nr:hypothetical protein [Phaeodactylibacter sp.]
KSGIQRQTGSRAGHCPVPGRWGDCDEWDQENLSLFQRGAISIFPVKKKAPPVQPYASTLPFLRWASML